MQVVVDGCGIAVGDIGTDFVNGRGLGGDIDKFFPAFGILVGIERPGGYCKLSLFVDSRVKGVVVADCGWNGGIARDSGDGTASLERFGTDECQSVVEMERFESRAVDKRAVVDCLELSAEIYLGQSRAAFKGIFGNDFERVRQIDFCE